MHHVRERNTSKKEEMSSVQEQMGATMTLKATSQKQTAALRPEVIIARYGTLESQHIDANIAMQYYGVKKD